MFKTKGDFLAHQGLKAVLPGVSRLLGEPEMEGLSYVFQGRNPRVDDIRLYHEVDKKFLGRIYALVCEARIKAPAGDQGAPGKLRLTYQGSLRKGRPVFKTARGGGPEGLAARLNQDQELLDLLAKQDLEYLKIFWDGDLERWRALARPLGGSFIWVALPPIRYRVKLPEGHDQYMVKAMDRIALCIAQAA
ncbi:MAG: DUF3156 family protein [Deltaproteobacteria bacterium]|nr:DUF3156 family protein [Deltaproteobacteria bacterium]